jgi:hypothetical protein
MISASRRIFFVFTSNFVHQSFFRDIPMMAKLIAKIQREAEKTAPRPDVDVTTDAGWVDGA